MFSAFNPSKCKLGAVGSRLCSAGSSRGLPAGAGIRTHNLGLPRVGFQPNALSIRPTTAQVSLHLTHPKCIRTRSSGQPRHGARGAVRGSVLCSSAPQSWYASPRLEPATFWSQVRLSNHQATTSPDSDELYLSHTQLYRV